MQEGQGGENQSSPQNKEGSLEKDYFFKDDARVGTISTQKTDDPKDPQSHSNRNVKIK